MNPLVSVIIPNWNGAAHLPICFKALQAQTHPNLEVLLIDNASTDASVEATRTNFPWVTIFTLPQNIGFAQAVNYGISKAAGQIIIPLNNDTEPEPPWAQALVTALQTHPQAGMAASKMRLFTRRTVLHSAGDGFGTDGIPINRGVWQEDRGQFDSDTWIFGGCGGAVAYTKPMLDAVGVFDPDLWMYCEDVDLNWRAQLAGFKCVFAPNAVVYHHLSATGGGEIAGYYTGRNTLFVLAKSVPGIVWRTHWRKIIAAQLKIAGEAARAWRGKAARARLRGQFAGLIGLIPWLIKRRKVQAGKTVSDEYVLMLLS